MDEWYKNHGALLFKVSPKAYSVYCFYKTSLVVYNKNKLATDLNVSIRTIERINSVLEDFDLVSIKPNKLSVNKNPKTNIAAVCKKYLLKTGESKVSNIDKFFDPQLLLEIRKKSSSSKIRIEFVAREFGVSEEDLNEVKSNKKLYKKYRTALEQSLYLYKGTTCEEEFSTRLKEWKTNEIWGSFDVLGYFCHKYESAYNTEFLFPKTQSLFRSKETKIASQLIATLKTKEKIQSYIDWIFDVKTHAGFKIFGPGILMTTWLLNEFSQYYKQKKKITRTTRLPESYVLWCRENVPQLFDNYELHTYGNLKTLFEMVKNNYAEEEVKSVVNRAKEMGIIRAR